MISSVRLPTECQALGRRAAEKPVAPHVRPEQHLTFNLDLIGALSASVFTLLHNRIGFTAVRMDSPTIED